MPHSFEDFFFFKAGCCSQAKPPLVVWMCKGPVVGLIGSVAVRLMGAGRGSSRANRGFGLKWPQKGRHKRQTQCSVKPDVTPDSE